MRDDALRTDYPSTPSEYRASATALPPETTEYLRGLFSWNLLTIRQKVLAIAQKYHVFDEWGRPRFYVVRPPRLIGNLLAGLASFAVNLTFLIFAFRFLFQSNDYFMAFACIFAGGWISGLIRALMAPYRHIGVFTDETEQFRVLSITQDNKFGFYRWYTMFDATGNVVARARRSVFKALWRREWYALSVNGEPLCRAREDSLPLAILRRYLGPLFGILRVNFNYELPDGTPVGEYNRKLTLTDQYLLDLRNDPYYLVDRRVGLALAILLDSAEGR